MTSFQFAVLDLETTGLSTAHHHRIVEIAIVHVTRDGRIENEWTTLVNPRRDIGTSNIHGIHAADVFEAPSFEDIAGDIVEQLRGRVIVAHNLPFDAAFLKYEFQRLGFRTPLDPKAGLCTMDLAKRYLRSPGRSLEACCRSIGHLLDNAHAALQDARAAAALLAHYSSQSSSFVHDWDGLLPALAALEWPSIPVYGVAPIRRSHGSRLRHEHFLGKLTSRAEGTDDPPEANSYLELLDRVLLDRAISLHEEAELISAAESLNLTREGAIRCHRFYLTELARVALEDGIVTPEERSDLHKVAELLGLDSLDVDTALAEAPEHDCTLKVGSFSVAPGDAIVFTGEAPDTDRKELEDQAQLLGLKITGSVSKKTRLLIAADPDSLSGKAQKARSLGIPIVSYEAYLLMIGKLTRDKNDH